MRKFLLGLPAAMLLSNTAWGATCGDTTVVISGTGTQTYNPSTLNSAIDLCADSTMVITLDFQGDTLKFSNEIIVTSRPTGAVTQIKGKGKGTEPVLITESNASDPMLFDIRANDRSILTNFYFVRRVSNNNNHSVVVSSKGSVVRDCHFYTLDNSSAGTGALLSTTADSILVERCLFRAPPNGKGRSIAISASGSPGATRNEYRSNIFYSTGLYLTGGSFHIFANSFAGSRDDYNAIIIGSGVTNPGTAVNIQHNLFALKADTLAPIAFASAIASSDSIIKNAWSRSKTSLVLAVNGSNGTVTLNNTAGSNANILLPRGFSKYGPSAGEFKEYPLVQMRTDETLARGSADFGKIPRFYGNAITNWTTMPDVNAGLPNSKLYFSGLTPFFAGDSWKDIKVGALTSLDSKLTPSPLDSGALGKALRIVRHPSDSTRMKVSGIDFNPSYYDSIIPPAEFYFFFSSSLAKLASNDSATLKTSVGAGNFSKRNFLGFDSSLSVPKEVRTGSDIYVKLLHYKDANGQGAVLSSGSTITSNGTVAKVTGVPAFPINDLAVPVVSGTSDTTNGQFVISVTKSGSEAIDSILVTVIRSGGGTEAVLSKKAPAQGSPATFDFTLPKGLFSFTAAPVARVGTVLQTGSPTAATRFYNSRQLVGDTVWVATRSSSTGCETMDGSSAKPFCTLDAGLTEIGVKKGGTILVKNFAGAVAFDNITIAGADSFPVTISVPTLNGQFDPTNRVAFRGTSAKEALVISRKNVTLRGFIIEMPAGAAMTAMAVSAGGVNIDGCIFRPTTAAVTSGPAILIEPAANQEVRFVNNLIWGFATAVNLNSGSSGIRVLNNTFVEEPGINVGSTGITAPAALINAVIANNYFSGVTIPYGANIAGKTPKLDHNAYTVVTPGLQGLSEIGAVDSVPRLGALDMTKISYADDLKLAMGNLTDCSIFKACNAIYAGSSTETYGPAITTDVVGKVRIGKNEIGAFEAEASLSAIRGVLGMDVVAFGEQGHDRLAYTITRKTYDPSDADSIHVWWSTGPAASLDDKIPAGSQKHYPLDRLASGTLTDTARGLENLKTYYIYSALGKTSAGTRVLGFGYRGSATTTTTLDTNDCKFGQSKTSCPINGVFAVTNGDAKDKFFSTVTFSQPDTGFVKVPQFTYAQPATYGKVDINSPMPIITLSLNATLTATAGSKQSWIATIQMAEDPGTILNGKDLFILPTDPSSLPTYVSTWELTRVNGKVNLVIEGTKSGTFEFGFGNILPSAEAGKINVTTPDQPPTFSFKTGKALDSISMTIKGSGFNTANPLVMVTPISAGGTYEKVFDGKYPNKTLLLSADLATLDETLRNDRFFRYYQRAVAADSTAAAPVGTNKPFSLIPTTADTLLAGTVQGNPSLALSGNGDATEVTLTIPISPLFKDELLYKNRVGRTSRSLEVVFTTFDGSKISRTSGFIRTEFNGANLQGSERKEFSPRMWNLLSYPWDEADTGSLARIFKSPKFSKDEHRLMKYKGTGTGIGAFIAYDGLSSAGLTFDAGQAVWSGTTGATSYYMPDSYSGISLDYKTFELALTPGQWNDVGLPFNFPIKWKDVLNASGMASLTAWKYNPAGKEWTALTLGNPTTNQSVVHPWEGIAVFPAAGQTALKFPVLDSARSATPMVPPAKVATGASFWSARIVASNPTATMSLRIGMAGNESVYPEAPDVPGQDFRVALKRIRPEGQESLSELIQAADAGWQGHWAIKASASKDGFRMRIAENAKDIPIYLVETLARKVLPLAGSGDVSLSEEDLRNGDYHLVAGDSRYLEDVLNGLVPMHMLALSNYPNPFSGSTLIRYALPESFGKVEFRMKIRDSRGRLVWEKTLRGRNSLRYVWEGRDGRGRVANAGFYTLTLEAVAPGKATQRSVRRILKM